VTGFKHNIAQRIRDIGTAAWWRAHALMIAPWVAILIAGVIAFAVYSTTPAFRAEIDHAFSVVMTGDQELIRAYLVGFGAWAPVVSIGLMVAQVIVVGIPATIVLFANGVAFGTSGGAAVNIAGRMLGAIVAFGIARMLGKGAVEKLMGKISHTQKFEAWMERWGGWAVFATRAIPGMPSDILSYVAGFTKVSWRTYTVATFFGFLPQSILYAWVGAEATGWFWAMMLVGTVVSSVLAASAIVYGWIRRTIRRRELATVAVRS
jgi:uncharacterized membrane protein YdjX (TVP38/TMEM64 family)